MQVSLKPRDIAIEFKSPGSDDEGELGEARGAILKLARALARMAAREDDAMENGV
jgi:hypothetical protein